jgi:hypothetical protein
MQERVRYCFAKVPSFATPEEAARAELGAKSVRFVGTVVRGDEAIVAHWVTDAYRGAGDTETTTCCRDAEGWEVGSTGNGDGSTIFTAPDRVTAVYWGRAPEGAVAGRFRAAGREQVVAVEHGFFVAVFDDLPYQQPTYPSPRDESPGFTGFVRTNWTPEEARAWMTARRGFEFPELIEWVLVGEEAPD